MLCINIECGSCILNVRYLQLFLREENSSNTDNRKETVAVFIQCQSQDVFIVFPKTAF